jgi:integrase
MSSIYKKGSKIYVSWYDQYEGKVKNKSTGLVYNKENMKKASQFAKEFQKALDERNEKLRSVGIKKATIDAAINHFLKNNSDKNKLTVKGYNTFFDKFTQRFDRSDPCSKITKLSCEDWLTSFRQSQYQQNTLFGITKILKKFLRFLFEYNYVPMFVLNKDVTYKPQVKPIVVFSGTDLIELTEKLDAKNNNFTTTFYLLLYTGLRPSDIYNLKVEDVDLENKVLRYYSPKSKDYFEVPFHPELKPILEKRIDEVKSGNLLCYETIGNMGKAFRRFLKQIGLNNKGYNMRTFRKSFITTAHESGLDLATVSKLAGHYRITTTEKYYNKLSLTKKASELDKINFRGITRRTEVETEVVSTHKIGKTDG